MTMKALNNTVIQGGYCIGCGACKAVADSAVEIVLDSKGCYQALIDEKTEDHLINLPILEVCPFSEVALTEDDIGRAIFNDGAKFDPHLGFYRSIYAGYVEENGFRVRGSSGGIAKWILFELLRQGQVDTVIQVADREPSEKNNTIYEFRVMHTPEEVLCGSKSVYYPVELSGVLDYVQKHPAKYVITGIPCFIKAVRLLANQEQVFKDRISYCVGIICGHLKSKYYADMIAWQLGVEPGELGAIDFRKKLPGATAKQKGVAVRSQFSDEVKGPEIVQNLFGTDYNHGFFQYKACDYCDDVVAETADISVGDAWLPQYIADGRGTSLVIVRHPVLQELIETARKEGRIHLEALTVEQAVASQLGGFRQRREGLAYRLYLTDKAGKWRPPKRVQPSDKHIDQKRKTIYQMRMRMAERSHHAFKRAYEQRDFEIFRSEMEELLNAYQELYRSSLWERILKGLRRRLKHWFNI